MNNKKKITIAATILITIITFLVIKFIDLEKIKIFVNSFGNWSPIIYIMLFAILPIFFFPVPVLALAGGYLFGLSQGSIYTVIGAMLNCTFMFFISRYLYGNKIRGYINGKVDNKIKDKLLMEDSKEVFLLIFILRLIPLVPYNLINYSAGLSSISLSRYLIASLIGVVPGTIAFINVGDKSTRVYSREFIISIILLMALIIIPAIIGKKIKEKNDI